MLRRLLQPGRAAWALEWTRGYATELPDNLLPVVAIIGRPNVGKSALFNRLVRRREALVHDTPGGHVTRDYQEGVAKLADLKFKVIDTSGLEPFLPGDTIQARATALTGRVLNRSDVALLLIDGQTGALPPDEQLARWLRKTVVRTPSSGSSSKSSSSSGDSSSSSSISESSSSSSGSGPGRPRGCHVLLAANKCERRGVGNEALVAATLAESVRLGFGEPVALSAMTGEGLSDLYEALQPLLDPIVATRQAAVRQMEAPVAAVEQQQGEGAAADAAAAAAAEEGTASGSGKGPLKVAIMGLPNVGKSTLTNWLLQDERCLTGPEPGLTRDAIKERIQWEGHDIELVDTAGWIRRTKLAAYDESGGAVAEQTVAEAKSVMQFVHVVALLVDAQRALELREGLTHREVTLASDVVSEGRLLLIVANKLDALTPAQRQQALALIRQTVEDSLPDVSGVPIIGMSALTGKGADRLLPAALSMYSRWNLRVPTSKLNRWIEQKAAEYQAGGGKELNRVTYISQVKARPPTFVAFVSGSSPLSTATTRFLAAQIRQQFGFSGVPLRITVRMKQARGWRAEQQQRGIGFGGGKSRRR
ncbi:GTPase Der [Chlorella sorokiniana]|uniref:GTPase Der n=1 Tax=Chlorella sorokiniana TaxID=3076 RepID=A0A2P6TL40_CHLSO|nr:GTPase Der [Chlorella sorokiniana]|eukprot:PRW45001.1 GTPase Der [Chlorella sorokiniana]